MARFLFVYASETGNTQKVIKAMGESAPEGSCITDVSHALEVNMDEYDVIFIGFWTDKSGPCDPIQPFLRRLRNKRVVLVVTMGGDPDSEQGYTIPANAGTYLSEGNCVFGVFLSRGAIARAVTESMKSRSDAEGAKKIEAVAQAAASHPDQADLQRAKAYMNDFMAKYALYFTS